MTADGRKWVKFGSDNSSQMTGRALRDRRSPRRPTTAIDERVLPQAACEGRQVPKTVEEIARETGFSVTTVRLIANGHASKYRHQRSDGQNSSRSTSGKTVSWSITPPAASSSSGPIRSVSWRRSSATPSSPASCPTSKQLCRGAGLVLLTASTNENPELEDRVVYSLWARGVDGLIVAPCRAPDYGRLFAKNAKMPIVAIDRVYPGSRYTSVASYNVEASLALTRAVLETGAPMSAFLCGQPELPTIAGRIRGFAAACQEVGHNRLGRPDPARRGQHRRRRTDLDGAVARAREPAGLVPLLVPDGAGRRGAAPEAANSGASRPKSS